MTTSGTTVFSNPARDLAHEALWENGIVPNGEEMDAAELSRVLFRLNSMLKSWQAQGALWKQETISVNGTADTATITLPAYVRGVTAARYVSSATHERPLHRWERDDYLVLPNKAASGTPSMFYVERNAAAVTLHVWPVPVAAFELNLDVDRAMDTVTDGSETLDLPEELTETIYANLALRCCNMFGQQPADELVARARMLERQMLDDWRPAFYRMEAC